MIEKIIFEYLKAKIVDVPIYLETPTNPPAEYILIMVSGIREQTINIHSCLVTIQSYSKTMYQTSLLNERIWDIMENSVENNEITHCKINSSSVLNDLVTKRYRYQTVYDLTYYRRS